jgi:hypothetical protein
MGTKLPLMMVDTTKPKSDGICGQNVILCLTICQTKVS